ncbi:MAG: 2-hydroxyacid dehydrogenase [Planctomycetota bacterium]|nr:MAG: 2-hydroxyacid dehydrogenase [Planctomycetota bacterium]
MHVIMFSTRPYDREYFEAAAAKSPHQFTYIEAKLNKETAALAQGYPAVCVFVNDQVDADVLEVLHAGGTRFIVLRCAGYNNVDLATAARYGMQVARVPAYSPHAVAEHAVAMILCLNRRIHRAYVRVREGNFSLNGLIGFDLAGKTVGVVGTGAIGTVFCRIMQGFDCKVIAYDVKPNDACRGLGVEYVELDRLWADSDIISLHCPLTPATRHLINAKAIARMRRGVMLINTSRGAVIDTPALIEALKRGHVGYVGLDVYEEEAGVFFEDLSNEVIPDDLLARLLTFPNVLITGHQGFLTHEALTAIAETTIRNLTELENRGTCANCLAVEG